MDKGKRMILAGLFILLIILCFAGISYYNGQLKDKEEVIATLRAEVAAHEAEATRWKAEAQDLAERVLAVKKKVVVVKQKVASIKVPQSSEETVKRLDGLGLHPEVDCDNK